MRFSIAPRLASLAVLPLLLAQPAAAANTVAVTTCGQLVPRGAVGVLTADLDCSMTTDEAVRLSPGAKLRLSGFTLTASRIGVLCDPEGACRIFGPGTIRRPTLDTSPAADNHGVFSGRGVALRDGVTLENWRVGVWSAGAAVLKDVVINGCVNGAIGWPARAIGSTFTHNTYALVSASGTSPGGVFRFGGVSAKSSTFSGNEVDLASHRRPAVIDSTCSTSWHVTQPATPFSGGDDWNVCG